MFLPSKGTTRVDVTLAARTASLEGKVLDADGAPVSGALWIKMEFPNESVQNYTRTETDGRYSFEELPAGEGRAEAYAKGHPRRHVMVELIDGSVTRRDIDLYAGATIRVRLVNLHADFANRTMEVYQGALALPPSGSDWLNEFRNLRVIQRQFSGDSMEATGLAMGVYTIVVMAYPAQFSGSFDEMSIAGAVIDIRSEDDVVDVELVF